MSKFNYRTQNLIDELSRRLDAIEKEWPMTGNYARMDPYIVPYIQCGKMFELIIYHHESQAWFDCAVTDGIISMMASHKIIGDNDVVFDLGCNAGAVTVAMASLCARGGAVHSFDPYPWNALSTEINARLNGLTNVTAYQVGLSNRDYKINVGQNETRAFVSNETDNAREITIHDIKRSMILKPSFLKIDIEGAEHDLFSSLDADAYRSVRAFVLEFHPFWIEPRGIDPKDSLRNIGDCGFDLSFHNPNGPKFDVELFNSSQHLFWGRPKVAHEAS